MMSRLDKELQRLYRLPGTGDNPGLSAQGQTRTLCLHFARSADWESLAKLCEQLQQELALPAPAISVAADHGFVLWLSLARAVPLSEAAAFLNGLRQRYLAELADEQLALLPDENGAAAYPQVPAQDAASGKWSAFIDPGLGAMFCDEAGLDIAPNPERQADLLAGLASISTDEFQRALQQLVPTLPAPSSTGTPAALAGRQFDHPRDFLLAVMNDPNLPLNERLRAAEALRGYFLGSSQ